jgi:inner membrane protein
MSNEIIWGAAGILLIIADVVFGTFFMLFLGISALITGALVWSGALPNPTWQWLTFAVLSSLGVILFRKKLVKSFGPSNEDRYQEHTGQKVQVVEEIPSNGTGRVLYRGAEWPATSRNGETIEKGTTAIIVKNEGITLIVDRG